jgi:hypothetical protein
MRIDFMFVLIPSIIFLLIGIIATILGVVGLTSKQVVFMKNIIFFGSMKLIYLSFLYYPAQVFLAFHPSDLEGQSVLGCICIVPILIYLLYRINRSKDDLSGYTVIGVDKTVLEVIADAVKINGISFEEMHEDFYLSDLQASIITTFNPINGTVSLRVDSLLQYSVLEKVICVMKTILSEKEYYYKKVAMMQFIANGITITIIGSIFIVVLVNTIR